ncbi:LysR family transcriptional regulator [Alteribacillus sp. HJP-4]|uniref:LysR family transcriptional regulator n=1 Tax=Alteribacillus sp. HJP-4 TaxID=2775394 RepID=UPI0035CCE8A8
MESRQLSYFAEVVRQQSFTKAAAVLRIAQPAISRAVQQLEAETGLILLIREKKLIRPTEEGMVLYRYAEQLRNVIGRAENDLAERKAGRRGTIEIGLPSMAGSYYFPEKMADFKNKHPLFHFKIREAGTTMIEQLILDGELEIGMVVTDEVSDSLEVYPLLQEPMVMAAPHSHPFAKKASVPLHQLADEPLILFKEGYFQRRIIDQAAELKGREPEIAFETNQISMAKSLSKLGFGVSVFLKMVIHPEDELASVPFDPPVVLSLGLAHKKGLPLSAANQTFLSYLLDDQSGKGGSRP